MGKRSKWKDQKHKNNRLQGIGWRTANLLKRCIFVSSIVHLSLVEVKATLCKLLRPLIANLDPIFFWMSMLGFFITFLVINSFLANYILFLYHGTDKQKSVHKYHRAPIYFRRTRRGTIYSGYQKLLQTQLKCSQEEYILEPYIWK